MTSHSQSNPFFRAMRIRLTALLAVVSVGVSVGVSACTAGADAASTSNAGNAKTDAKPSQPAAPAVGVEVAVARHEAVAREVVVSGQVEAVQAIELQPEIGGRITRIYVREGQPVAAGAPLFHIDDGELRAQVARATAERDLARQTLERTLGLLAQDASTRAELERAEAAARGAQAQLDLLALRLARTTVRAPFQGVAGQRFVSLGDVVSPQTRLVSLQTSNPQRVALRLPERYAAELRRGQSVQFNVAAFPNERFKGAVEFVDPVVALPARTITVKALVPNPAGRLQSGMFVEARVATAVRARVVVIPEEAVMPSPGGMNAVWVEAGGKVALRPVELGVRRAGTVEVTRGLSADERVVVGGLMQLTDGAAVTPRMASLNEGERRLTAAADKR